MKRTMNLAIISAAAILTACSAGSTTSTDTSQLPSTSGTQSTAVDSSGAAASPTTSMTCTEYQMTASRMSTLVHYVALNVGTDNDSSTYYPQIDQAMAVLTAMTPTCAPAAVAPMAAFATTVEDLKAATRPGTDAATVAADKAALAKTRAAGIVAWKAMGMPTAGWENRPEG